MFQGGSMNKALSIRAPWWHYVLHGGKDIENRTWPTKYRGPVFIHASKWWSAGEVRATLLDISDAVPMPGRAVFDSRWHDARGCIVGRVDIIDCVATSASPWFFGPHGFVLANPVAFAEPIPCKGALGFFTVPADVLAKIGSNDHG